MDDDFEVDFGDFQAFDDETLDVVDANVGEKETQQAAADSQAAVAAKARQESKRDPPPAPNVSALFPNADPNLKPVVSGVIARLEMGVGVDLRELACRVRNIEFVPNRASTATLRLWDPTCAALIRASGSVTVIGVKSAGAAKYAAELVARIIRKALELKEVEAVKFCVSTMLARFDLKHSIRLDELHRSLDHCSYEPETFCACILKLSGYVEAPWAVSCSIYVSGKVTLQGARSKKELMYAFNTLLPMIAPFAKK